MNVDRCGISIWWWVKVILNFSIIAFASYLGITSPEEWRHGWSGTLGQILVLVGAAINLTHFLLLRRHNQNLEQPNILLADIGLFLVIRHPMYFGELIVLAGFTLLCANLVIVCVAVVSASAMIKLCLDEDAALQVRFGSAFEAWKAKTKLVVPGIL